MKLSIVAFMLVTLAAVQDGPEKRTEDLIEDIRAKIGARLAKIEVEPKDPVAAQQALGRELRNAIDKNVAKLRPDRATKTYLSRDKRFMLVVGANGGDKGNGENVKVTDKQVELLVVIAGDGNPAAANLNTGAGGTAYAHAEAGIALAVGGRGGVGLARNGGGGGGAATAEGAIGSAGFGGEGGDAIGGGSKGGAGGSSRMENAKAIRDAIRKRQTKESR